MIAFDIVAFGIFVMLACCCVPLLLTLRDGGVVAGIRMLVWGILVMSILVSLFDMVSLLDLVPLAVYSSTRKIVGRLPILGGMLLCLYQFYKNSKRV